MSYYALRHASGADVVATDAAYEAIRLWRSFRGGPRLPTWDALSVTMQRRAFRADVLRFLRNAPAVTARGAEIITALAPDTVELLPLRARSKSELFVLNPLRTLPSPPFDDRVAIFRIRGCERDGVYFSDSFRARAEAVEGLGMQFVSASDPYPRRAPETWPIGKRARSLVECSAPASHERVRQAEARIGLRFPESLRWLFANANGGRPSDGVTGISELVELGDGRGTAERVYEHLAIRLGLVPWTWFPFAHGSGGDDFFVDCSTPEGSVFLYLHDTFHEPILPLLGTLADFVGSIVATERGP